MRIVFFGTPLFAVDILSFLVEKKKEIVAVVTQPSRLKGRAKEKAFLVGDYVAQTIPFVPLFQPQKASSEDFIKEILTLRPDVFVVVAYGQILSQALLDVPRLGCINVHASLLPKLRGAAPIQRAILNGEIESGVTIMKMVLKMDAGDILAQASVGISEEMTGEDLEKKLSLVAKPLLLDVLHKYAMGGVNFFPQKESDVTFAPKLQSSETGIVWDRKAQEIHNQIRAFSPHPGAHAFLSVGSERKMCKVLRSRVVENKGFPGEILSQFPFVVACGDKGIEILEVQLEGKKAMAASDWIRGVKDKFFFCQ
ncbi:MAG: methionyl-tRNA formyltransferase [Chlamydiota bacterium]